MKRKLTQREIERVIAELYKNADWDGINRRASAHFGDVNNQEIWFRYPETGSEPKATGIRQDEYVKEATRIHRNTWTDPLIAALFLWSNGEEVDLERLPIDLTSGRRGIRRRR